MIRLSGLKLSPMKIIMWGYIIIILAGALLLMLPVSSREGTVTPPVDAVFTAASATCVTGLVLHDTYSYWSGFGQTVLLILIQIGGVGFMTFTVALITLTKKTIGPRERYTMQESVGAPQMGGIVRMTRYILCGTLLFEGAGALLLALRFVPEIGFGQGIFFAVFHSVSAFCNAGFDLFGKMEPYSSLTGFQGDAVVNLTIMALIVIGGLGFFVWLDIQKNRLRFRRYRLHSKLVLASTALLIFGGAFLIGLFELHGTALAGLSAPEKALACLFQSVSPRTAGFNTVVLPDMTESSILLMIILMIIGGSSGSTAGGIKTTTFSVLSLSVFSELRQKKSIECFMRRVDDATTRRACCVVTVYLLLSLSAAMAICFLDSTSLRDAFFETVSALSTVGLSLGITGELSDASHLILAFLMYCGRVGSLTLVLAFSDNRERANSQMPLEKVTIG